MEQFPSPISVMGQGFGAGTFIGCHKGPIRDVAASVRQRLLNLGRATNRPFHELLQYFAMERFLYRLSQSPNASQLVAGSRSQSS